ncbi:endonuclease III domain-containing protein [Singulisphaera rosea]
MATQSKAQLLNDIHGYLKKRYKLKPERSAQRLTVLESVVYGICHEETTAEQANQALSRFKDEFFDWNEVRVSSLEEIQRVLVGLPNPDERALRLRRFLRQLFEKTYGFNLEAMTKKPLKESIKSLQEYEALGSDYVTATVTQQSLGGHAMPIDSSVRRTLERLGIADPEVDTPTLRGVVERAVPKNRGAEFLELFEELAHDTCVADLPDCPRCELKKVCPTGLSRKDDTSKVAAKSPTKDAAPSPPKSSSSEDTDSKAAKKKTGGAK